MVEQTLELRKKIQTVEENTLSGNATVAPKENISGQACVHPAPPTRRRRESAGNRSSPASAGAYDPSLIVSVIGELRLVSAASDGPSLTS